MSFSETVKTEALVACARHCCICHKFVGLKIELHHIKMKSEGGKDTLENCIPLCFECHADMRSYDHKHPKGTKYTQTELRIHRESWFFKVKNGPTSTYGSIQSDLDIETYKLLVAEISRKTITFMRENNFAGFSFLRSKIEPLYQYADTPCGPEREFVDTELEGLRGAFHALACEFADTLATNTWICRADGTRSSVPAEWESEQPDRFYSVVQTIHSQARRTCNAYDDLVRAARRKFGILVSIK